MSATQSSDSYSVLVNSVLPVYSISHLTGFAPPKANPPAVKFSSPTLDPWLDISQKISSLLGQSNAAFRTAVENLPLLSVPDDAPVEEWRLAYVILSTVAAAYVWGKDPDSDALNKLPYVLARPLQEVADALDVEAGLVYIAGGIWNHRYREDKPTPDGADANGIEDAQLDTIVSFTGLPDETHFNLTTLRVERAGGEGLLQGLLASQLVAQAIRLSLEHTHEINEQMTHGKYSSQDEVHQAMATALQKMAASIEQCTVELAKMRNGCDPMFFYNQLRPFLSGFGSHPSQSNGVFYPSSPDNTQGEWLKLSGATAGQSSLFQAFDALLMISHPTDQDQGPFVKKMRKAMPGCHVKFLESLPSLPSLRSYMQLLQSRTIDAPSALAALEGYNAAVRNLEGFRNEHIKIVTLYVIGPARRAQQTHGQGGDGAIKGSEGENLKEADDSHLRGTGGSNLARLLKGMRDDTKRTVLERKD